MEAHSLAMESIVCASPFVSTTSANSLLEMESKRRGRIADTDMDDSDDTGDDWKLPF